jgi:beta-galactosidase
VTGTGPATRTGHRIELGPALFDAADGSLVQLAGLDIVHGPRVELWRAPTDNDQLGSRGPAAAATWRAAGLHRLQHRIREIRLSDSALVVHTRVAPPSQRFGLDVTCTWSTDGTDLNLLVQLEPAGEWPVTVPRLGLRMALPGELATVQWLGLGPGEAYADSIDGVRLGRWQAELVELQTPYVRPQENGQRLDVRWARISRPDGRGLQIDGEPSFGLGAHPWSTEALERADHLSDLTPDGLTWLYLDHAQHGLGSHSCGPDVLEPYRLHPRPTTFSFRFRPLGT